MDQSRYIADYVKRHQKNTKLTSLLYGLLAFIYEGALLTFAHPEYLKLEMIILGIVAVIYGILFVITMQKRYEMMKMRVDQTDLHSRRVYLSRATFNEEKANQRMILGCTLVVIAILFMDVIKIELYNLLILELICVVVISIGCALIYQGNATKSLYNALEREPKECLETVRALFTSGMLGVGLLLVTEKVFFVIAMAIFPAGLLLFCLLALAKHWIL